MEHVAVEKVLVASPLLAGNAKGACVNFFAIGKVEVCQSDSVCPESFSRQPQADVGEGMNSKTRVRLRLTDKPGQSRERLQFLTVKGHDGVRAKG
jgi:hypothetical protein